ncbi:hypothetical protein [Pantoea piersonii]|uniref:hypothetical protein n=1 Tax=Pantoea piersonii TaxID=2364647 RepID=UPI0022F185E7|nr:hypothetical protein [Pantoea piersonii]WBV20001.1 hypothetical protein PG877_10110 [Pantoea piersonii]
MNNRLSILWRRRKKRYSPNAENMHFSAMGSDFVIADKSYLSVKIAEYMEHFVVISGCDTALHFSSAFPLQLAQRLCRLYSIARLTR